MKEQVTCENQFRDHEQLAFSRKLIGIYAPTTQQLFEQIMHINWESNFFFSYLELLINRTHVSVEHHAASETLESGWLSLLLFPVPTDLTLLHRMQYSVILRLETALSQWFVQNPTDVTLFPWPCQSKISRHIRVNLPQCSEVLGTQLRN